MKNSIISFIVATKTLVDGTLVTNNSSFQNYSHPDDHTRQTPDNPGFKKFTMLQIK